MKNAVATIMLFFMIALSSNVFANDVDIYIALSDRVLIGAVESINKADQRDVLASYYANIRTDCCNFSIPILTPDADIGAVKNGELASIFLQEFFLDGAQTDVLLSEPGLGISNYVMDKNEYLQRKARLSEISSEFIESIKCDKEIKETLSMLKGRKFQEGIDKLFDMKEAMSGDRFFCLIKALDDKGKIKAKSFKPPYPGAEGVYHRRFGTLGDLIAYLLPHLYGEKIYVEGSHVKAHQDKLRMAWFVWGCKKYDIHYEP